jgi:hypothetical protein
MQVSVAAKETAPFMGRLAVAFVELTLAAAVIVGAIFVGHDLRDWRDWYPNAYHPWLERAQPGPEAIEPTEP